MAGTYSKIYIHIVFAVKGRENLLQKEWREEVFKYIAGIIKEKDHKPIIINGYRDHVHCFIGLTPSVAISDLVRDIKNNSSKFINEKKYINSKFHWQEGYGAFSYSHSQIKSVYDYILNQENHHQKKSFKEEYLELLKKFEVEYKTDYLYEWIE
ncbi:IS200/IS605 family transposase [Ignavibacterium album]|uniref:IS200/IS605 family transposase n=1 Tax=Ignavibacterium album TaxID=591197 RepID=UPI0026EB9B11|nr:IS200/IS605 family transposase [Ignavibacterium album]